MVHIPRWGKWIIGIVLGLIVLLSGLSWYLSSNYKPLLQSKITEKVIEATGGLYRLTIEDLDVSLLRGSLILYNAKLSADTVLYGELVAAEKASASYFDGQVDRLKVENVSIWRFIFGKELHVSGIAVDTMSITVTKNILPYSLPSDTSSNGLYAKIKDSLKELKIGKVQLANVKLEYKTEQKGNQYSKIVIDSIRAQISDFVVGPDSESDTSRIFYSSEIALSVPGFHYAIPNSPYRVAFDDLKVNSKTSSAEIIKLRLEPRIKKVDFFRNDNENKTLMSLHWDTVRLENWHINKLVSEERLYVQSMLLSHGSTLFMKDKRYQEENVSKIGQAPHQQIMKLQQLVIVDTVRVRNVDIVYRQMHKSGEGEGMISFNNARGIITNLSNDTSRLHQDRFMRADLRANLMGTGGLHAVFGFDMLSPKGDHSYKGSLSSMHAKPFNKIMTPLLNLEFASGDIARIAFDVKADDYQHTGQLKFDYDDFKINILKAPDEDGDRKKKPITSFLVNQFVLNESNPDSKGEYHVGQIQHKRVPEHSHFKSVWKSLLDGIVQCVGIDSKLLRRFI